MSSVLAAAPSRATGNHSGLAVTLAAWAAAMVVLLSPAIANHFALVFDDVGGYLDRWPSGELGNGRSAVYGMLLWLTSPFFWIPAIMLQALVAAWTVYCTATIYVVRHPRLMLAAVSALVVAAGAPLLMSQVMPDAWAGPAVLSLALLALYPRRLSRTKKLSLASIVAFAGAAHMATFGLLAGLSVLCLIFRFSVRPSVRIRGAVVATISVIAGFGLLLLVDFIIAGRAVPTPGGSIFLFGRLMESGFVGKTLARECPRPDWRFCDFMYQMPPTSDELLWDGDSPLYRLGGWDDPAVRTEVGAITSATFHDYLLEQISAAVRLSVKQFFTAGIGDAVTPMKSWLTDWIVSIRTPWLVDPLRAAVQQNGGLDVSIWNGIAQPIEIGSAALLPWLAGMMFRRRDIRGGALPAFVFVALIGNAALCGFFSGVNNRYQARVDWIAPLIVAVSVARLRQRGLNVGGCSTNSARADAALAGV